LLLGIMCTVDFVGGTLLGLKRLQSLCLDFLKKSEFFGCLVGIFGPSTIGSLACLEPLEAILTFLSLSEALVMSTRWGWVLRF